ncbi:hypothetical protein PENSPDRAFT_567162, partial [Peniophora sp. CONT]
MVYQHISEDRKWCAMQLWEQGWPMEDICSSLKVGQSSVYRWLGILEEFGTVIAPPARPRGRPSLLSRLIVNDLVDIFVDPVSGSQASYLDELQLHLALKFDLNVSTATIDRHLTAAGITRKLLHKIAKERNEADHERDCYRRYGRSLRGMRADSMEPFDRGTRVSLVAGIDKTGYIAARAIEGALDGKAFYDFIVDEVLPQMNAFPAERSVLILDNCNIHHSEMLREVV